MDDPAPSAGVTASNPYETQRRDGVQDVLDRWADAVRTHDIAELESIVDPAAPPEFLQSEIARSDNLRDVPLSDWGYEIVDGPETVVPSAVASPLNAADVYAPSVVLRYAVDGPDTESSRRPVSLLVAERDDQWRLVSDSAIPGIDRTTWRGPWDFGPVVTTPVATAGGTSIVLSHPGRTALAERLAAELPAAVDAVSDFYGDDWPRTALVVTTDSEEEFAVPAGEKGANTDAAAVTVADTVVPGQPPTGQRIFFGPQAQDRLTAFTTRSVLRHELTHVAARADTVDGSPMWILEGFADYAGYRGSELAFDRLAPTLSSIVAAGGPPTVLPQDSDFTAGGIRSTLAYESAWSICAFVAERFGEPALRALYGLLATGQKSAADVDGAFAKATGSAGAQFLEAWGSWVSTQSR